jgi:subtilisin family serine protease
VRLWRLPDRSDICVDLLVALGDNPADRQQTLTDLRARGLRLTTWTGRIPAGWCYARAIPEIVDAYGDAFVEAAPVVRPALDVTVPEAWNVSAGGQIGQGTGKGVVIGIVDSGIDVTHPDFISANGTTRILKLWDQEQFVAGQMPAGYSYGREWDAAAINAHLASQPDVQFTSADHEGHGTAVAGICAGNGRAAPARRYVGVARSADLIVVKIESRRGAFASSDNVVDAVKYVFDGAQALGRRPS